MKLKICGIRDIDILKYTCDMGVNFAGFIMPDDSPRKISNHFISSALKVSRWNERLHQKSYQTA